MGSVQSGSAGSHHPTFCTSSSMCLPNYQAAGSLPRATGVWHFSSGRHRQLLKVTLSFLSQWNTGSSPRTIQPPWAPGWGTVTTSCQQGVSRAYVQLWGHLKDAAGPWPPWESECGTCSSCCSHVVTGPGDGDNPE